MMNSTNNLDFVKEFVANKVGILKTEIVDKQQVAFEVKQKEVHLLLSALKSAGWIQMSYLSAVDWIEENKFEIVYVLFN